MNITIINNNMTWICFIQKEYFIARITILTILLLFITSSSSFRVYKPLRCARCDEYLRPQTWLRGAPPGVWLRRSALTDLEGLNRTSWTGMVKMNCVSCTWYINIISILFVYTHNYHNSDVGCVFIYDIHILIYVCSYCLAVNFKPISVLFWSYTTGS